MIFLRRVRREFQRRQNFREKNPVAKPAADDVGVLADKANAGALRQIAFQQRPGVHIPKRTRVRAAKLVDELRQTFQSFAEHVVVVGKLRIAGNKAGFARFADLHAFRVSFR